MRKENLNNYELFYLELPQADYLKDIEIQDAYDDPPDHGKKQGLSDEQVSQLARDSLKAAGQDINTPQMSEEQRLFRQEDS